MPFFNFTFNSSKAVGKKKSEQHLLGAPDVQGRVFAARRLIAWITNPITPRIAGPLADLVFEPAMLNPNSPMAQSFGWLVGAGAGAGMAVIMAGAGVLAALVGLAGYVFAPVRDAEDILPDHNAFVKAQAQAAAPAAE